MDWGLAQKNAGLLRFTRMMIQLRQCYFAMSRDEFVRRVTWHGTKLGDPDWTGKSRTLAFQMHGWHGQPDLYVMFNAHWEPQRFFLPPQKGQDRWRRLVDTILPSPEDISEEANAVWITAGDHYYLSPRSTVILASS